jgi:hypothetical protein
MSDLTEAEFDRQAAAAAQRAVRDDSRFARTRARLGVGVPTRKLRCEYCGHFLKQFDRDVWAYATTGPGEKPDWREMPKPSRRYDWVRCKWCHRATVYVIA